MATTEQKFLDYPGLEHYHQQNIATMDEKDVSVLDNSKSYTDSSVQAKGNELGTRIDNLILNAGDSSAECADARVTKDGTVHDTLKNRLDTEYSQLSSEIVETANLLKNNFFRKIEYDTVFKQVSYEDNGEAITEPAYNRCYSIIFPLSNGVKIIPRDNCEIGYYLLDENKQAISGSDSSWLADAVTVMVKGYICIRARFIDRSSVNDNHVLFDVYSVKLEDKLNEIRIDTYYEHGSINYNTGVINPFCLDTIVTRLSVFRFLRVGKSTNLTALYNVGTLYVYEYDENKNFILVKSLNSNAVRELTENTRYIRIEHDDYIYSNEVILRYYCDDGFVLEYGNRLNQDTIPFAYRVNTCNKVDDDSNVVDYSDVKYFTSGLLRLPPNYNEYGDKVPIIYFSHGSADYYTINTTEFSNFYMEYIAYLQDEGFAIFDCFGWTTKYSGGSQVANPTNMAAIKQGIEWVCRNYNVDLHRVYVTGKSLGGLQAVNMCYEGDFPIKACCPLAPEIDSSSIGFGYDEEGRKSYAKDCNFSEDTNNVLSETGSKLMCQFSDGFKEYMLENADKTLGYNPLYRNLIGVNASELMQYQIDGDFKEGLPNKIAGMNRICVVPTKIFCAPDDIGLYPICRAYIQSIKNCGGVAELRTMPSGTGGHHAVDNGENALKVDHIITECGISHTNVPLAYVEMVDFFRRYK